MPKTKCDTCGKEGAGWSIRYIPEQKCNCGGTVKELVELIQEWTPQRHTVQIDGQLVKDEPNPYPFVPVVLIDTTDCRETVKEIK